MNETPQIETPPNTRRRRRWWAPLAFVLLVLLAGAITVGWWNYRKPLSDEERQLVGVWRFQPDGRPQIAVLIEIEFRADRTCRWRGVNLKTGELSPWDDPYGSSWQMSGDRLVIHHPKSVPGTIWYFIPSKLAVDEVLVLIPDGPDRFRYESKIEVRSTTRGPPATGTISRITATE